MYGYLLFVCIGEKWNEGTIKSGTSFRQLFYG